MLKKELLLMDRYWGERTFVIQRTNVWQGSVSGQSNVSAAFNAGYAFLDNYNANASSFTDVVSGKLDNEYLGHSIAYRRTVWLCFRIWTPYQHPLVNIDIKSVLLDGGNGTVELGTIRTHSQWHKDFVLVGHGGDKGHYGARNVTITFSGPPLLGSYTYHGEFWINSN